MILLTRLRPKPSCALGHTTVMIMSIQNMHIEPIDDDSARCHKNDCEMYVCPVAKGIQLKQADVENLDYIAPLMYKLEIPVDIFIPNTVPVVHRRTFVQKVLARVSTEFDR